MLRRVLGEDFFDGHTNEAIRNARGFVFIKDLDTDDFFSCVADLEGRVDLHDL
mgnify:FL=1